MKKIFTLSLLAFVYCNLLFSQGYVKTIKTNSASTPFNLTNHQFSMIQSMTPGNTVYIGNAEDISTPAHYNNITFYDLDAGGNIIIKKYAQFSSYAKILDACNAINNYAAAGYVMYNDYRKILFTLLDKNGNITLSNRINIQGYNNWDMMALSVSPYCPNNILSGYFVCGFLYQDNSTTIEQFNKKAFILRLDINGNVVWTKLLDTPKNPGNTDYDIANFVKYIPQIHAVYLTGSINATKGGPNTGQAALSLLIGVNGNQIWSNGISATTSYNDRAIGASAVYSNANGLLYLLYNSTNTGGFIISQIDPSNGAVIQNIKYLSPYFETFSGFQIVTDADNPNLLNIAGYVQSKTLNFNGKNIDNNSPPFWVQVNENSLSVVGQYGFKVLNPYLNIQSDYFKLKDVNLAKSTQPLFYFSKMELSFNGGINMLSSYKVAADSSDYDLLTFDKATYIKSCGYFNTGFEPSGQPYFMSNFGLSNATAVIYAISPLNTVNKTRTSACECMGFPQNIHLSFPNDLWQRCIDVDNNNNVYVAGSIYDGNATYTTEIQYNWYGTTTHRTLTPAVYGNFSTFIACYLPCGNRVWEKIIKDFTLQDMLVFNNYIYLVGSRYNQGIILKYDSNGGLMASPLNTNTLSYNGITTDGNYLYVTATKSTGGILYRIPMSATGPPYIPNYSLTKYPSRIACDQANGKLYVILDMNNAATIKKFYTSTLGPTVNSITFSANLFYPADIAFDPNTNQVLYSGTFTGTLTSPFFYSGSIYNNGLIVSFNNTLSSLNWYNITNGAYSNPIQYNSITYDASGNAFVTASRPATFYVYKFDESNTGMNTPTWTAAVSTTNSGTLSNGEYNPNDIVYFNGVNKIAVIANYWDYTINFANSALYYPQYKYNTFVTTITDNGNSVVFRKSNPSHTDSLNNENAIQIYPNPFKDEINIRILPTKTGATVKIIGVTGKLLKEITITGNTSINTSALPKGLYLIRIKSNKTTYSAKIIKD